MVPSSKFQLNKKDIKILEKAFKTLYLFQASLGQVDERSVERSYLQLLKKHRALLSESTSYEFDIRQKRKSKITKVEKAALNIDKFKVPKDYSQSLFSIKN